MKQYEVDVTTKHSHGRYGKIVYTSWCLSHTSKAGAEDFALDILSGKTWKELIEEVEIIKKGLAQDLRFFTRINSFNEDDIIGLENAERFFSFKAYKI